MTGTSYVSVIKYFQIVLQLYCFKMGNSQLSTGQDMSVKWDVCVDSYTVAISGKES